MTCVLSCVFSSASAVQHPLLDLARRVAGDDGPGRDVLRDDRASGDEFLAIKNIKSIKTITPDYHLSMFFMLYTAIRTAIRLHRNSQIR